MRRLFVVAGIVLASAVSAQNLPRLVPQIGHEEGARVTYAAFSPDGAHVATADASGNVVVWETASGTELRRWAGPAPYGVHFADEVTLYVQRALAGDEALSLVDGSRAGVPTLWPTDWDMAATLAPYGRARSQNLLRVVVWGQYVSPPEVRAVRRDASGWHHDDAPPVALVDPAAPSFAWPADPLLFRLSPDGRHVAGPTGVGDEAAVWSAESGRRVATLGAVAVGARRVPLIAFPPSGEWVASVAIGAGGPEVDVWSLEEKRALHRIPLADCQTAAAIAAADGGQVAVRCPGRGVFMADPASSAAPARRVEGDQIEGEGALALSPDAALLVVGTRDGPALVETEDGTRRLLQGAVSYPTALASDGDRIVGGYRDGVVRWETETGRAVWSVTGEHVRSLALTADGIVLGGEEGAREIGPGTSRAVGLGEARAPLVAVSPDGQWIGAIDPSGRLTVRSRDGAGTDLDSIAPSPLGLAFDGEAVVVASARRLIRVPLTDTGPDGSEARTLHVSDAELDAGVGGVAYSALAGGAGGILAATTAGSVYRWRGEDPEPVRYATCFRGATASGIQCEETVVAGADASAAGALLAIDGGQLLRVLGPDDERAAGFHPGAFTAKTFRIDTTVSAGRDGTLRLWDASGALLATLVAERDGAWLVVTPDGRFDAPDLERIDGAVWVAPDDPLTPVPVEAFMREFYEPRLLPRLLAGETFRDMGSILDKNRVQPRVEITSVEQSTDSTATVTVSAEGLARTYADSTRASGVRDLRLFRDGQLVGWTPADSALVGGVGTWEGTFTVPLPSGADSVAVDTVSFSAYAFNRDLVKSRTARATLAVHDPPDRPRRAFVVSLGVDAFADSTWNLAFAAADARAYTSSLTDALRATDDYAEVVSVPLVSASDARADEGPATAKALRAALALLAGHDVPADERALVPHADRLRPVSPDDVVILTASTHGFTDADGVFYLLPQEIPSTSREITPALLDAAISSDELGAWLREVDAGTLALVVDACYAASAVEGAGFKPGPMGARGLGQLAYNKGMLVLTATQASDVALESADLKRGLLTFALVENGLLARQADATSADPDGETTLAEWLEYGVRRVPELYREVREGAVQTFGRGLEVDGEVPDDAQIPSLFDFRRRALPVRMVPPNAP